MSFPLFDKLYGAPNLLTPNEKPVGEVELTNPDDFFGYWLLNNSERDISTGGHHGALESGATRADKLKGLEVTFDGSSRVNCGLISIGTTKEFTLTLLTRMDGSGSDEHALASNWRNDELRSALMLRVDPSASNQIEGFVVLQPSSLLGGNFTDLQMVDNRYQAVTLRFNANDGTGLSAFLDNAKSSVTFSTSTAIEQNTSLDNFYIGDTPHNSIDGQTGATVICMFRKRALTDTEIFDLHNDLYQDLESPNPGIWLPEIAAVGGVTLLRRRNPLQTHLRM